MAPDLTEPCLCAANGLARFWRCPRKDSLFQFYQLSTLTVIGIAQNEFTRVGKWADVNCDTASQFDFYVHLQEYLSFRFRNLALAYK
jgi:hypothetical protein